MLRWASSSFSSPGLLLLHRRSTPSHCQCLFAQAKPDDERHILSLDCQRPVLQARRAATTATAETAAAADNDDDSNGEEGEEEERCDDNPADDDNEAACLARRQALLRIGVLPLLASSLNSQANIAPARAADLGLGLGFSDQKVEDDASLDLTITDRAYLDITKCPSIFSSSRETSTESGETGSGTLSSSTSSSSSSGSNYFRCDDGAEALGRIVIGLYGKQVPQTVENFKVMCTGKAGSSYKGCLIHRVITGQYIMAGKQGSSRARGEVLPPTRLDRNLETISPDAFKLRHLRPGTVSLCLAENDDEDQFRLDTNYRNVEFLITTGPGPAPQLDSKNIVFGRVLEGLDVVRAAAAVPVYKPSERIRQFNELASFLGDERASNARSFWYRPLKALYISDCGML